LALFAVVAFLVSSGIFSSNSFMAQECTFQPELPCPASILYQNGSDTTLRFSLVNGLGFPMNITAVNYTVSDMGLQGRQVYSGSLPAPSGAMASGAYMNFTHTFNGTVQPGPGSARQIMVSISYKNCKTLPCTPAIGAYTTTGRISAFVQRG
jgi:hypothetical protein